MLGLTATASPASCSRASTRMSVNPRRSNVALHHSSEAYGMTFAEFISTLFNRPLN